MKAQHRWFIFGSLLMAPAWLQLGGCRDSLQSCEDTLTCEPDDGGGTSSGGDLGETGGQGGLAGGGAGGAGDCESCPEEAPACKDGSTCVECTESETDACTMEEPHCDPESSECVACLENEHCLDENLPLCVEGECAPCTDSPSCGDLGNHCLPGGACVECTPETDNRETTDDDCGAGVCNPETNECEAGLTQKDKDVCDPCIADNECMVGQNCIPLEYTGGAETVQLGGFCMKIHMDDCLRPYTANEIVRSSLSGALATGYCGLGEQFTSCEAITDLKDFVECGADEECGSEAGEGRCETVNGNSGQCTYSCTSNAQCVAGFDCDGPSGSEYCGG